MSVNNIRLSWQHLASDVNGPSMGASNDAIQARVKSVQEFIREVPSLSLGERRRIVDQALVLIEQLYVHLPLKQSMHGIDPVQKLKLFRHRLHRISRHDFHGRMLSIFSELRDLHTNYILPDQFQDMAAVLPFRIQEYFEGKKRLYMVSEVEASFGHPYFAPGVIVTHWNGIPIDRAVALNADRQAGSNEEARHARGLVAMTIRPLEYSAPPDEEWVDIAYRTGGERSSRAHSQNHEIRICWQVMEREPVPDGADESAVAGSLGWMLGIDWQTEATRRVKKMLFAPEAVETDRRVASLESGREGRGREVDAIVDFSVVSKLPDILQFRPVDDRFGYLRIRSFMVDPGPFLIEVIRILDLLPQEGLIIDIRGNPGGYMPSGEALLQLFTPRPIEPERLHFRNTPLTLALCMRLQLFAAWKESIAEGVETGAVFSDGFPGLPAESFNTLGQRYHGPVVLITDALCYSTADIFAAGFQDHEIGPILGTSRNTGAGGANMVVYDRLQSALPRRGSPFRQMPRKTSFLIAIRRTSRVGHRAGDPIEDLGVMPDEIHPITKVDLLKDNLDLIGRAVDILAGLPVRALSAIAEIQGDLIRVSATTRNISRLDVYVNGRPLMSTNVDDGTTSFTLPSGVSDASVLDLRGFDRDQLVAARRVGLQEG